VEQPGRNRCRHRIDQLLEGGQCSLENHPG
jgi:hypothetical protein